ncbi:MAG TPA: ABC transporter substrate-binding protein [Caldilineaceae bacterium]|nr:ABC transporter substrate-binding protein [Caldilineaceae bacterium]
MNARRSPLVRWLSLFLLTALLVSACAPAASTGPAAPAESAAQGQPEAQQAAAPAAQGEKVLTVALTTIPNSLDMPKAAERNASNASWQLYDSLLWINDEGELEPALATEWTVSEDGTTYTFTLREGVTFHNGEPFTAEAVVSSWERGKNPENEYFTDWEQATSVTVIDDMTVQVTTDGPKPLFLRQMAQSWAMTPPGYISEVGEEEFLRKPVGTGPFKLVELVEGDRIVMEKNENYWRDGYPLIDRLIFRPIPESSTRVAAIQTGEVDIVTRLSAEEAESLRSQEGIEVINYPVDRVYYIAFNNMTTGVGQPTEDPKVRLAMNYAVDVQAILDALFNGYGRPATGLVSSSSFGYDPEIQPYGYDPEKAKQLLAEAGYPDGFSIDMACPAGAYTNFEQVCEAVQGYLGEIGIQVNLEIMESGAFWDLEANKQLPPLFGDSWSSTLGESLVRLNGALLGEGASYSSWSDPVIIDLLNEISVTVDEEARAELYIELQRYMQENPPFIYLYEPVTFEAIRSRVENYKPRSAEQYYLFDIDVSE